MALLKPNRIISVDFLFWLQKTQKTCESISDFAAPFGEIITDMPYLCETEI